MAVNRAVFGVTPAPPSTDLGGITEVLDMPEDEVMRRVKDAIARDDQQFILDLMQAYIDEVEGLRDVIDRARSELDR